MVTQLKYAGLVCVVAATACSEPRLEECDIRQDECFVDVFMAVQDHRGTGWDPWLKAPPKRVITVAEYRAELQAQVPTAPTPDELAWYKSLQALQFVDRNSTFADESVDNATEVVAAYYSFATKSITIIDRGDIGSPENLFQNTLTLGHELVHAAQDREYNLIAYAAARDLDDFARRRAVIEGDAVLFEMLLAIEIGEYDVDRAPWSLWFSSYLQWAQDWIVTSTSPYFAVPALSYPLGGYWMYSHWTDSGSEGVRRVWEGSPPSGPELMLGEPVNFPGNRLDCGSSSHPEGYEEIWRLKVGSLYGFGLLSRWFSILGRSPYQAWALATDWWNDELVLYADPSGAVFVTWAIQMDNASAASAVERLFVDAADPLVAATAYGSAVVIVASNPPEALAQHPPSCP